MERPSDPRDVPAREGRRSESTDPWTWRGAASTSAPAQAFSAENTSRGSDTPVWRAACRSCSSVTRAAAEAWARSSAIPSVAAIFIYVCLIQQLGGAAADDSSAHRQGTATVRSWRRLPRMASIDRHADGIDAGEHRVVGVEPGLSIEVDEELRVRGITAPRRQPDRSARCSWRRSRRACIPCGRSIVRAGAATLDHEVRRDAMDRQAVVVAVDERELRKRSTVTGAAARIMRSVNDLPGRQADADALAGGRERLAQPRGPDGSAVAGLPVSCETMRRGLGGDDRIEVLQQRLAGPARCPARMHAMASSSGTRASRDVSCPPSSAGAVRHERAGVPLRG